MHFDEYQDKAFSTAIPYLEAAKEIGETGHSITVIRKLYTAIGLAGEAGEVADKIKKYIRDFKGMTDEDQRSGIAKELGDVLWYVAACATEWDLDLDMIAHGNLDKLANRQRQGTLRGEGDDR